MISLWQCKNAIYPANGGYIGCAKGHDLGKDTRILQRRVKEGKPLVLKVCQSCPDCDIMGEDIPRNERGWE